MRTVFPSGEMIGCDGGTRLDVLDATDLCA